VSQALKYAICQFCTRSFKYEVDGDGIPLFCSPECDGAWHAGVLRSQIRDDRLRDMHQRGEG